MATSKGTHASGADEYAAKRARAMRLLLRLKSVVREMPASAPAAANWSHAEALPDLNQLLDQIIALDEYLTAPQAAKVLGVNSGNTVKNWLKRGLLSRAFQTTGGGWRFPRRELEEVKARMEKVMRRDSRRGLVPTGADQ